MASKPKEPKTLTKYGLTLNLPDALSAEVLWVAADAEASDFPLAEVAMQVNMLKAMIGDEEAQKVRDKGLSVEQTATLIADIQAEYAVDAGK